MCSTLLCRRQEGPSGTFFRKHVESFFFQPHHYTDTHPETGRKTAAGAGVDALRCLLDLLSNPLLFDRSLAWLDPGRGGVCRRERGVVFRPKHDQWD